MDDFLNRFAIGSIVGGVALLLGALGIYGVVGLMVATRAREIAVRVTLGASRSRVMGMILFDVVKLVGPGVAVGVVLTAVLVRLDGGVRISNSEPLAYVAGDAIATLTAVVASLAPARRAASVRRVQYRCDHAGHSRVCLERLAGGSRQQDRLLG